VVSLGIFSVVPPTEPCALRSTQTLKLSTRDFSWGKGGQCVWLTTYHSCSVETSRKSGALIYPQPPWATSACRRTPLLYFRSVIWWISVTYILLMHLSISHTFKHHSDQIVRCLEYNANSYFCKVWRRKTESCNILMKRNYNVIMNHLETNYYSKSITCQFG